MKPDFIKNIQKALHFLQVDREHVMKLQQILKDHHKRDVSYEEAEEVGRELIGLYECLADGRPIIDHRENDHGNL